MGDTSNFLIPGHRKLDQSEISILLDKYGLADSSKLPKIKIKDAAIASLDVELGDVIEITRKSFAGETKYYRVVIE